MFDRGRKGERRREAKILQFSRLVSWKITDTIRNWLRLTGFRWQNDETKMLSTWLAPRCVLERTTLGREPMRMRKRERETWRIEDRCLFRVASVRKELFFLSLFLQIKLKYWEFFRLNCNNFEILYRLLGIEIGYFEIYVSLTRSRIYFMGYLFFFRMGNEIGKFRIFVKIYY